MQIQLRIKMEIGEQKRNKKIARYLQERKGMFKFKRVHSMDEEEITPVSKRQNCHDGLNIPDVYSDGEMSIIDGRDSYIEDSYIEPGQRVREGDMQSSR